MAPCPLGTMPPMNPYSEDLREKIVEALGRGTTKSEAARSFGVSRSSVKRYAKLAQEGRPLAPKKRPGSKPKRSMPGGRGVHEEGGLRNPPRASLGANSEARADCGLGQPFFSQGREGEGDHRGERLRASLSAALFTGLQSDRAGALEGEGDPAASRGTHSRIADRSDGPSAELGNGSRHQGVLRPLWLPFYGSTAMTSALEFSRPQRSSSGDCGPRSRGAATPAGPLLVHSPSILLQFTCFHNKFRG
jgi:transposase-like protein